VYTNKYSKNSYLKKYPHTSGGHMHAIVTLLKITAVHEAVAAVAELDKETSNVLSADYEVANHSFRCKNPFLLYAKNTSVHDSITTTSDAKQIIILRKITTHDQV
jgi:hypothetical protein